MISSAEDFVAELRHLRTQAGDPSFRQLSRIARNEGRADPLPPSTTSDVLAGKRLPRLPRLEFVESYVAACLSFHGRDEPSIAAEVARWRERWRALATPEKDGAPLPEPADRPAPRRPLILVAGVFLAGLGVGIAGTVGWTGRHTSPAGAAEGQPGAEVPDVCVSPGTAVPDGQDVLRLPAAGKKSGSWWVNDNTAATLSTDGRRFRADVAAGTARPGDVLIVKSDVALVQGRSYVLAFAAAADHATTIRVRVQDSRPPSYHPSYDREVSVDRETCLHHYRFVATKTSDHSELTFQVGGRSEGFQLQVADAALVAAPA
ncbi:hypothetical protein AB0J83_31570 [Actinoplanes sp. NPDC049596]|uniref:hypothetical protein n=1 Tax=unclassified Actinoplanes TaxID=2626549 RepID=UPI00341BBB7E